MNEDNMKPHWNVELYHDFPESYWIWVCSSCGYQHVIDGESPEAVGFYHCPWCGTRLIDPDREGEDE